MKYRWTTWEMTDRPCRIAVLLPRPTLPRARVETVPAEVRAPLDSLRLGGTIKAGQSVALTAGSRGIANIPGLLKAVAQHLRDLGARPFIVPAMGSHGEGTAEGQR